MKKFNLFTILVLAAITISFNSCDKAADLEGTYWEGYCSFYTSNYSLDQFDRFDLTIFIDFLNSKEAVIYTFVDEYDLNIRHRREGTAQYQFKGKKITLDITWEEGGSHYIDADGWIGTIEKNVMTLGVLGQEIRLERQR